MWNEHSVDLNNEKTYISRFVVLDLPDFSSFVVQSAVLVWRFRFAGACSVFTFQIFRGNATRRVLLFQVQLEQLWKRDGRQNADAGGQRQHQTDHDSGKIDGADGVQDDEDSFVVDVLDAVPEADGEYTGQDVQVEEEWEPGGGLMFAHRCDDGDVDLGVAGVP